MSNLDKVNTQSYTLSGITIYEGDIIKIFRRYERIGRVCFQKSRDGYANRIVIINEEDEYALVQGDFLLENSLEIIKRFYE